MFVHKKLLNWMAVGLMLFVCYSIVACSKGGDDDGGGSGSGSLDVNALIGKTFYTEDLSYITSGNSYCEIEFKSVYFASVHMWGRDYDEYSSSGTSRWDYGWIDCMFDVKDNTMTIHYKNDDYSRDIVLVFKDNKPTGWQLTSDKGHSGSSTDYGEAKPGTADMFGFYVDKSYTFFKESVESMIQIGDTRKSSLEKLCNEWWGVGWLIVDGNTISRNSTGIMLTQPGTGRKTYHTESVYLGTTRYTIYYYYDVVAEDTYKYVMNGSNVMVSNGEILTYSSKKLTGKDGYPFIRP